MRVPVVELVERTQRLWPGLTTANPGMCMACRESVGGYRIHIHAECDGPATLIRVAYGGHSMRVIAVSGLHRTGKTTTVEHIVGELVRRGYAVGTIKTIHREGFSVDTPGKNTHRHRRAGAKIAAALSPGETAVIIDGKLSFEDLFRYYDTDWIIIEGAHEAPFPKIVCARTEHDIEERVDEHTFLICGEVASAISSWRGIPVLDATSRIGEVVDMVESRVPEGSDRKMIDPAAYHGFKTAVYVDGKEIPMVPFVQDFVARTILGMLSSLRGYETGSEVRVEIRRGE